MPRFRRLSTAALAVLPALPLIASLNYLGPGPAALGAPAPPGPVRLAAQTWDLAMTRHFGHPGNAAGFSAILITGGHLWAFGGTNPGGSSTPVADQLTGKQWTSSALPAGLTDFISDASATSNDDIWAISSYGRYVLHWDGTRWQLAHRWDKPGALSDVVATSPGSAWVFGTTIDGTRGVGTWHFDGQSWRRAGGAASDIYRASAVSGGIWAIAARARTDAILRFDGRRWHQMRGGSAIAGIRWRDILAESARDVWLLGDTARGRLVFAHWDGARWRRFATPVSALAGQLAAAGNGGVLATATAPAQLPAGLIVTMTSKGRVTTAAITSALGCGVSDAVVVARTGAVWASGGTLTKVGGNAAVWVRTATAAGRDHDDDDVQ